MKRVVGPVAAAATLLVGAVGLVPARAAERPVAISGFAFRPARVAVDAGDTVAWTNRDSVLHSVTADDGSFDRDVSPDATVRIGFTGEGTIPYHCKYHPSMRGEVGVRPAGPTTAPPTTAPPGTTTTTAATTTQATATTTTRPATTTTTTTTIPTTTAAPTTGTAPTLPSTTTTVSGGAGASADGGGDGATRALLIAAAAVVAALAMTTGAVLVRRRRAVPDEPPEPDR